MKCKKLSTISQGSRPKKQSEKESLCFLLNFAAKTTLLVEETVIQTKGLQVPSFGDLVKFEFCQVQVHVWNVLQKEQHSEEGPTQLAFTFNLLGWEHPVS